jgi:hypothetical protein
LKYLDSKQDLPKKSSELTSDYYKEAGNPHDGNGFVHVLWRDSGAFSVITGTWIIDKRMLNNPEILDMIPRPQDN